MQENFIDNNPQYIRNFQGDVHVPSVSFDDA